MQLFRRGTPSPAQEHLDAARAAYRDGDAQEALRLLTFGFGADPSHRPLYELARDALQKLDAPDEAALFQAALSQFNSAQPFFDLGYHFLDVGHDRMAIPFLERAHSLAPYDLEIATELAVAYCGSFQPQRALEVLSPFDLSAHFWADYQKHWCQLLCDQRSDLRAWIVRARASWEVESDEEMRELSHLALDKLEECAIRLEAVDQPRPLVQDWHFIQYGGAILDFMDERITEDGLEVAGGHYVYQSGSPEDVRSIVEKLKLFLEATHRLPQRVLSLPDRDSQIIGLCAAKVLQVPWQVADEVDIARPHQLIVAANARSIEWEGLSKVCEGQTLWAFNLHWLEEIPICPDVTGLMSQIYFLPWQGGAMEVDSDTLEPVESTPDERDAEIIVAEIAALSPTADPSWPEILQFYTSRVSLLKGVQANQTRLPFRTDSPVPGSYFC